MQLTGSQIVIECLKEQGVDTVFGYPGGAILNIYDELYKKYDNYQLYNSNLFYTIRNSPKINHFIGTIEQF